MSTPFAISLAPNRVDPQSRPFSLDERVWKLGALLVERQGYKTNSFAGLSRRDVPVFAQHLRRAVEQGSVSSDDKKVLDDLLAFMAGAGAGGFGITRGFKSWRG